MAMKSWQKEQTLSLRANEVSVAIQNEATLVYTIDCYENSPRSFSRNDKKYCHLKRYDNIKNLSRIFIAIV